MRARPLARAAFLIVALALALGGRSHAAADPDAATIRSLTCAVDDGTSARDALGFEIADVPSLRFVALERAATSAQLEAQAAAVPDPAVVARLQAAIDAQCTGRSVSVVSERAFALALARSPSLAPRAQYLLLIALNYATAALASRDRLKKADVDAALAPFGTSLAALTANPPDSEPSGPCAVPDAAVAVVERLEPVLPGGVSPGSGSATVRVRLAIGPEGLVRSATLRSATVPPESALVEAALIAAASSTYRAARASCRAVAGAYDFTVQYEP